MKRILFLIAALLACLLLCVPSSAAETYEDLSRIYKNLSTYIYPPYFEDSKYFEEYKAQMEYVEEILNDDDITQEEIDNGYYSLKAVYGKMMKDTYDYSELPNLVEHFEKLDKTIFTEDSWKKVVSTIDETKTQLDTPSIYYREEGYTKESYNAKTQSYIDSFQTNYADAFNQLEFNEAFLDDRLTKEELKSYHNYISACVNDKYMKTAAEYYDLKAALENAKNIYSRQNPSNVLTSRAMDDLKKTFLALSRKFINYTIIREEISTFHTLSESSFEQKSFQAYSRQIESLIAFLDEPQFFYVPTNCNAESFHKYCDFYLSSVVSPAKSAYKLLLPVSLVDELQTLCNKYKSTVTIDGLELKLTLLKNAIKKGEELLLKENSSAEQYEDAIKAILDAYSDLKTAEAFLIEEQSEIVKQDADTIKMILIYALIAIALAVGFACVVSKQHYGIIDWTE